MRRGAVPGRVLTSLIAFETALVDTSNYDLVAVFCADPMFLGIFVMFHYLQILHLSRESPEKSEYLRNGGGSVFLGSSPEIFFKQKTNLPAGTE